MRWPKRWVGLLVGGQLWCAFVPISAQAEPTGDAMQLRGKSEQRSPWKHSVEPELRGEYSSNPFHVDQRRLPDFDTDNAPGERFYQMKGPGDFELVPRLSLSSRYRFAHRRDAEGNVFFAYHRRLRTTLASYVAVGVGAGIEATRNDRLRADLTVVPRRFHKNYRADGVDGDAPFTHARYAQYAPRLRYSHAFSKSLSAGLFYRLKLRRYEAPHVNHDKNVHELGFGTEHELGDRLTLSPGLRLAATNTPNRVEAGGFPVDRSHRELTPELGIFLDLPHRFDLGLLLEYRWRRYSTNEELDEARYHRRDRRPAIRVEAHKRWSSGLDVGVDVGWLNNRTNRNHPDYTAEELAYRETTVGASIGFEM